LHARVSLPRLAHDSLRPQALEPGVLRDELMGCRQGTGARQMPSTSSGSPAPRARALRCRGRAETEGIGVAATVSDPVPPPYRTLTTWLWPATHAAP